MVRNLAAEYGVDKKSRTFSPWSHVVCLLYCHLTHSIGLSDLCDALRHHSAKLFAVRGATPPSRNGLSHANKGRNGQNSHFPILTIGQSHPQPASILRLDLTRHALWDDCEKKLVLIGRCSAVGAMLVAMGLVPLLGKYGSIFAGLNTIIAHIARPVTAVFLWGVIWKRASYRGALATMIGVTVFTINSLNPDGWLATLPGGFMMMAFYLFLACSGILITVSILMPKKADEDPESLYFHSFAECFAFKGWSGIGNYKFLAILVLSIMAVLYYVFR